MDLEPITLNCKDIPEDTISARVQWAFPNEIEVKILERHDDRARSVYLTPDDARILGLALLDMAAQAARAEG